MGCLLIYPTSISQRWGFYGTINMGEGGVSETYTVAAWRPDLAWWVRMSCPFCEAVYTEINFQQAASIHVRVSSGKENSMENIGKPMVYEDSRIS